MCLHWEAWFFWCEEWERRRVCCLLSTLNVYTTRQTLRWEKRARCFEFRFREKSTKLKTFLKKKTWQRLLLYLRGFPSCSILRFGVSLPQSKAPLSTANTELALGSCSERLLWGRGLDSTGSCGCRIWGCPVAMMDVFKNDKDSIEKGLLGRDCNPVLSFNPQHHKGWGRGRKWN